MQRFLLTSIICKVFKPIYFSLNKINSINNLKPNVLLAKRYLIALDRKYSSLDSSDLSATKQSIKNNESNTQINDSDVSQSKQMTETIEISERCVERLKKVLNNDEMLRLEVLSGGCSGLSYKFDTTNSSGADDHIFQKNGVKVVTDSESLKYIKGSTIDYSEELIKSAFRVTNNPQSEQGCSCGASFSLKFNNEFKFKT